MTRYTPLMLLFGASLAAACSDAGSSEPAPLPPESTQTTAAADHEHDLQVDWVSLGEGDLYGTATAIVRGRVISQRAAQHRSYPVDLATGRTLTPEEAGDDYAELPLTISVVSLSEPLFQRDSARALDGTRLSRGARVEIVQLGGFYADGCWVEPNAQHLLRDKEEVVAFLSDVGMRPFGDAEASGVYSVVGGRQGLVPIESGLARPIDTTPLKRFLGMPTEELDRVIEDSAQRVLLGELPVGAEPASDCEMKPVDVLGGAK